MPTTVSTSPAARRRARERWWLALGIALLLGAGCAGPSANGRYVLARDPGSRHPFEYIRDRESGRWIQRDCELRVSEARVLPEPLNSPEHGSLLSVVLVKPESLEGAGIRSLDFARRDGYRIWQIPQVLGEHDLADRVDFGVQVKWPDGAQQARFELFELIHPPALTAVPQGEWSAWIGPSGLRAGGFAGIEEVSGAAQSTEAPPEHPFELRCRLVLTDIPGFVP